VTADRATLEASDFAAFRPLAALPLGMTAHVVYTAIDPDHPATTSVAVIAQVIRGYIGFDGALMSDDVSMGALSGSIAMRTRASFAAGCDLALHCNGKMDEMQAVASESPTLSGEAARRTDAALAARKPSTTFDPAEAWERFSAMIAPAQIKSDSVSTV
jgi:beta-N-acetylhexosaminidase